MRYLPVDRDGRVDPAALAAAITPEAVLVSIMAANNETGVLGDDLCRCGPVMCESGATDGEVVGLGSSCGEHHLSWLSADQACELLAR
jgi:hypothetical protein